MTDNQDNPALDAIEGAEQVDASQLPQFRILAQYVKDQSFENPNSPDSFKQSDVAPSTDVGIDVQARRLADDQYEAALSIKVETKRESEVLFIGELVYAGIFLIKNVPEEQLQPALLIECPRMLFPFARRIVADMTRDGGFPPVMLDPIDFAALYRAQLERAQQQAAAQSGAEGETVN